MVKLKFLLKKLILSLGYSLLNMNITKRSDDPFIIINKLLPDFDTKLIVDAGASIGETSKKLSKFFPKAKIHAIEPFPKFYHILEENCKKNANITPYNFALSDVEGTVSFNINKSEGTNSLFRSNVSKDHPHHELLTNVSKINVFTKKLDNLFPSQTIDILKLDIQGGEYNTLIGAMKLLTTNRIKSIICEVIFEKSYHDQKNAFDLISLIETNNFKLFNLYQCHYHHGKLLQADALFFHKSIDDAVVKNSMKYIMAHSKFLFK
jgi:FkbM family methyltransferase